MVIAVDTGNRCIKTAHAEPFSAGLVRHYEAKPFVATDTLFFDGQYYSFSQAQGERREDKTEDDYYFILTLAAIAREIIAKKADANISFAQAMKVARRSRKKFTEEILLAVGLPPRDLVAGHGGSSEHGMADRFRAYFLRHGSRLEFTYNDIAFDVTIKEVLVSAQGFAAIFPNDIFSKVTKYPQAFIIDIGGYTTDIALVANRRIDLSFFESLDFGVIYLCSEVADIVRKRHGKDISGILVEAILRGETIGDDEVEATVREATAQYVRRLTDALRDRKIDLGLSLPVLVGGGANLLEKYLKESIGREVIVISDIRANAIGYEIFANRLLKERKMAEKHL